MVLKFGRYYYLKRLNVRLGEFQVLLVIVSTIKEHPSDLRLDTIAVKLRC